jgi:hypothetical protein
MIGNERGGLCTYCVGGERWESKAGSNKIYFSFLHFEEKGGDLNSHWLINQGNSGN